MFERVLHKFRLPRRSIPSLNLQINAVIEPDGDGFHGYAPALKGLHVYGETEAEVTDYLDDAVRVYLMSLAKHGDPLPIGSDFTVHHETAEDIPAGAIVRDLRVSWPTMQMSGVN